MTLRAVALLLEVASQELGRSHTPSRAPGRSVPLLLNILLKLTAQKALDGEAAGEVGDKGTGSAAS